MTAACSIPGPTRAFIDALAVNWLTELAERVPSP